MTLILKEQDAPEAEMASPQFAAAKKMISKPARQQEVAADLDELFKRTSSSFKPVEDRFVKPAGSEVL